MFLQRMHDNIHLIVHTIVAEGEGSPIELFLEGKSSVDTLDPPGVRRGFVGLTTVNMWCFPSPALVRQNL